jgi:hypothetical protein
MHAKEISRLGSRIYITYFSREKGARMKETDVGDHVVYADDH